MRARWNPLYKRILDEIEREAQTHPDYADLQNQLALLLRSEGEMEKAETHFLKALHLNPRYREAILNLGFLYMEMGRWKGAEEIFLGWGEKTSEGWFYSSCLRNLIPPDWKGERGDGSHP